MKQKWYCKLFSILITTWVPFCTQAMESCLAKTLTPEMLKSSTLDSLLAASTIPLPMNSIMDLVWYLTLEEVFYIAFPDSALAKELDYLKDKNYQTINLGETPPRVHCFAVSDNGEKIIIASGFSNPSITKKISPRGPREGLTPSVITVWNLNNLEKPWNSFFTERGLCIKGIQYIALSVALTRDGGTFIVGFKTIPVEQEKGLLMLCRYNEAPRTLAEELTPVSHVAINHNGSLALSSTDNKIRLWDTKLNLYLKTLTLEKITTFAFSQDDPKKFFVISGKTKFVYTHEESKPKLLFHSQGFTNNQLGRNKTYLDFFPEALNDRQYVFNSHKTKVAYMGKINDTTVKIYDIGDGKECSQGRPCGWGIPLTVSSDGSKLLFCGPQPHAFSLCDLQAKESPPDKFLRTLKMAPQSAEFILDGKMAVVITLFSNPEVWYLASFEKLKSHISLALVPLIKRAYALKMTTNKDNCHIIANSNEKKALNALPPLVRYYLMSVLSIVQSI